MRGEMVWRVRVDGVDVDRIEKRLGRVVSKRKEGKKNSLEAT